MEFILKNLLILRKCIWFTQKCLLRKIFFFNRKIKAKQTLLNFKNNFYKNIRGF
jgi:hypothetical protein